MSSNSRTLLVLARSMRLITHVGSDRSTWTAGNRASPREAIRATNSAIDAEQVPRATAIGSNPRTRAIT